MASRKQSRVQGIHRLLPAVGIMGGDNRRPPTSKTDTGREDPKARRNLKRVQWEEMPDMHLTTGAMVSIVPVLPDEHVGVVTCDFQVWNMKARQRRGEGKVGMELMRV